VREYPGLAAVGDHSEEGRPRPWISFVSRISTPTPLRHPNESATPFSKAYCIVVTVSADNELQAFKIQVSDAPLFATIKSDARSRIQETAISPDAVLPGAHTSCGTTMKNSRRCAPGWLPSRVSAFAQDAQPSGHRRHDRPRLRGRLLRCAPDAARQVRPDLVAASAACRRLGRPTARLGLAGQGRKSRACPHCFSGLAASTNLGKRRKSQSEQRVRFSTDARDDRDARGVRRTDAVPRVPSPVVDAAVQAAVRKGPSGSRQVPRVCSERTCPRA